jgi:hypothetical protein
VAAGEVVVAARDETGSDQSVPTAVVWRAGSGDGDQTPTAEDAGAAGDSDAAEVEATVAPACADSGAVGTAVAVVAAVVIVDAVVVVVVVDDDDESDVALVCDAEDDAPEDDGTVDVTEESAGASGSASAREGDSAGSMFRQQGREQSDDSYSSPWQL